MVVEATKNAAPKQNMDSCRSDREERMGVLSYAGSGVVRGGALAGGAGDRSMIRAEERFWTSPVCACSSGAGLTGSNRAIAGSASHAAGELVLGTVTGWAADGLERCTECSGGPMMTKDGLFGRIA